MTRPRLTLTQTQRLQLTPGLRSSIHLLRADAAGLTRYLEEQAEANPHLRLDPPPAAPAGDWLPRWTGLIGTGLVGTGLVGTGLIGTGPSGPSGAAGLALGLAEAPSPSLMAHVGDAIGRMGLAPRDERIALLLAEALEPSGWLGRPLAQIAAEAGGTEAEAEAVLARLQRIEPAGLFARNLAECLALQLAEAGELDAVMQVILDRLDLLGAGDLARLARLARRTPAEIEARFRIIRGLDPKPGAQFAPLAAAALREPDLLVRRGPGGGWEVALNRSSLPSLSVRREAAADAPGRTAGGPTAGGAAALASARAVARLVRMRNDTLLRVGREILGRQHAALEDGPSALVAMTMADVAAALELHESTVSRVVAGASVDTPRGTWWLRRLFSAPIGGRGGVSGAGVSGVGVSGAGVSGAAVQARLAQLIAAERKSAPMSDAALAEALADGGAAVARRTVAKYRAALGIPPASRRRVRRREKPRPGA